MIILIVIPLLICLFGFVCKKADKRLMFCAASAAVVFAVCGISFINGFPEPESDSYSLLSLLSGSISFDSLGAIDAPPAYLLIMKICTAYSNEPLVFPIAAACVQTVISAYALYNCTDSPYEAGAVLTACFLPVYFAGSALFTSALICLISVKYVRERRFFRFAAAVLAASCFDMSALLLIPLYFVIIIPKPLISAIFSALAAGLAVIFPAVTETVYTMFGDGRYSIPGSSVLCTVISVIAALISLLMYRMYRNREGRYETLVPVMICGALLSAAALWKAELSGIAFMLLMMSAVPLAPDAFSIGTRFVQILFPSEKNTSAKVFAATCVAILTGICTALVLGDTFGASAFDAVIAEVIGT
ncbi:MAG: EpsG family protein [Ruminiclostridium sp.]|nr:EpsG family protein [Ruminiclostridium sp.]